MQARKRPRVAILAALVSLACLAGCEKGQPGNAATSTAPSASASDAASTPSPSASPAKDHEPAEPLILQELTFTSEVVNKEPVDVLLAAETRTRVWAHLRLRNRSDAPRKIHLEFRVNESKRTTLDLEVAQSWSYRTWAYNTLLPEDKTGKVSLKITDDSGGVLAETSVPIAAKARTKPYVKKTE